MRRVLTLLIPLSFALATKYAGDFEDLDASARIVGMGGCGVTFIDDPSLIYYNPSGGALLKGPQIFGMHSENFGGVVKNDFIGFVFPKGNQGFGLALYHNGIPDIPITTLPDTTQAPSDSNPPEEKERVNVSQWIAYLNYAKRFSILSLGGNLKFIYQGLGVGSAYGMGIDFGLIIEPSDGLRGGLRVRNLSTSPLFYSTDIRESIIPRISLGIAKEFGFMDHSFLFTIEEEVNLEGIEKFSYSRIGDISFEERLGFEYSFRRTIALRMGLYHRSFCFGIGGGYARYFLDYAYNKGSNLNLGNSHRISGGIRF